jgi:hypothetical protein
MKTIYGEIENSSLSIYFNELKNRTFSLLPIYEEQPFEIYTKNLKELLVRVISFEKIRLQKHPKFCTYIELLTTIMEPKDTEEETAHKFVRRHILDAVNLVDKMFQDIGVSDG